MALTRLDKTNGMFSFLEKPEDDALPQSEWAEEKVEIDPGEGLIWRDVIVQGKLEKAKEES